MDRPEKAIYLVLIIVGLLPFVSSIIKYPISWGMESFILLDDFLKVSLFLAFLFIVNKRTNHTIIDLLKSISKKAHRSGNLIYLILGFSSIIFLNSSLFYPLSFDNVASLEKAEYYSFIQHGWLQVKLPHISWEDNISYYRLTFYADEEVEKEGIAASFLANGCIKRIQPGKSPQINRGCSKWDKFGSVEPLRIKLAKGKNVILLEVKGENKPTFLSEFNLWPKEFRGFRTPRMYSIYGVFLDNLLPSLYSIKAICASLVCGILMFLGLRSGRGEFMKKAIILSFSFSIFFAFKTMMSEGDGYYIPFWIAQGATFFPKQLLSRYLMSITYSLLRDYGADVKTSISLLVCISGGLYTLLILWLGKILTKGGRGYLIVSFMLSIGLIQVFFGHVEDYAFLCVAMVAYIIFAVKSIRDNKGLFWPALILSTTILIHLSAVFGLPSLAYLGWTRYRRSHALRGIIASATRGFIIPLIITPALFWAASYNLPPAAYGMFLIVNGGRVMPLAYTSGLPQSTQELLDNFSEPFGLPIYTSFEKAKREGGGPYHYPILSFENIRNNIGEHLLISPLGLILMITSIVFWRPMLLKDDISKMLLTLSIPFIIFNFVYNPDLGMRNDWSLFAVTAIPYSIFASYEISKNLSRRSLPRLSLIIISINLIYTIPWIFYNLSWVKMHI